MQNYVTTERADDGRLATLTFADPQRENRLCWAAIDQLADAMTACRESGTAVVILASGLSGHWLQHAWLEDLCAGVEGRPQTAAGSGWFGALQEIAHEDLIYIAAISGATSGGGAELGWACDFRIAESSSTFTQPEIAMGLTTGLGGCSRLAHLAGVTAATEMVMTGLPWPAQRLYELGAINQVVAPDGALSAALACARRLLAHPPAALRGLKRILRRAEELPLSQALAFEQQTFRQVLAAPGTIDAVKSALS
jgi:enoyl-CoA hydratase/carnithine racemase